MKQRLSWVVLAVLLPTCACAGGPGARAAKSEAAATHDDRAATEKLIAGTVVGSLSERFQGRPVEARFGALRMLPIDARTSAIEGEGSLRFVGDPGWIGFHFRSIYDSLLGQPGPPEIDLGVGGDARPIPNDSLALRHLEDRAIETLQRELGVDDVRMQLDRVETVETGQHYLGIEARGLADFGRDGSQDIRIHALYDRRDAQWLRFDYDLPSATPVAQTAALPR
ncbi:hypothetical protein QLQ15_14055 [Lysobacter sp. LF1]|uniref:Outer membrane lipoprotein carrier protein LolA n=1 Tax=Lysobacter stagni TaxID=3045172 RepID=A0ABT6XJA3_9GAMM|nr:hypothetical protein [Lysobacter sp. LF1]MDI9240033.1 hypothetical protein [Lysobacter sp. LF1]